MLKPKAARQLPSVQPIKPVVQIWALRILTQAVPTKELVNRFGFLSEQLAAVLDLRLEHYGLNPDDISTFKPTQLKQLRHDLAEKLRALEDEELEHASSRRYCGGLKPLSDTLGLTAVEVDVLDFACASFTEVALQETMAGLGDMNRQLVFHAMAHALGHAIPAVKTALRKQGVLARSGVLVLSERKRFHPDCLFDMLNDELPHLLQAEDMDLDDVLGAVAHESKACSLSKGDYPHLQPQLDHLIHYLHTAVKQGQKGVNVLLYGPPGTGKSELSRLLAKELTVPLYEVSSMDSDGDPTTGIQRLRSLTLSQICLANAANLLLFDEVEDVISARHAIFENERSKHHKAWMNRQLEGNAVPTVWVTNSVEHMDPAMTRRFDVVMEVPVPPRAKREQIILSLTGTSLDASSVAVLADHAELSPAIVAKAASVARVQPSQCPDSSTIADTMLGLVNQTLKAQGLAAVAKPQPLELHHSYSLAHLNPDVPLEPLLAALHQSSAGRFCLFGPPGTGKTAFVRWVAQQLGRPLMVRRASDLMSKWVGGNEKNIAAAFTQAAQDGAVLLVDEVDTFLQPRQNAVRGWEASMVNEMLTQMETFDGIFFATTNLMHGMDGAAMRRFDVKVHFRSPTATQLQALLSLVTHSMKMEPPALTSCLQLACLGITPGDLAAVVRRARYVKPNSTSELLAAVEAEALFKPDAAKNVMGFL